MKVTAFMSSFRAYEVGVESIIIMDPTSALKKEPPLGDEEEYRLPRFARNGDKQEITR